MFKVGEYVYCVDDDDTIFVKRGDKYTISDISVGLNNCYIMLDGIPHTAFHEDRFDYVMPSDISNNVMLNMAGVLTDENNTWFTPKSPVPTMRFIHDDGDGVVTEMTIDGHSSWIKLLQHYINFMRGLSYRIKDNDVALSTKFNDTYEWHGNFYEND